MKKALLGAIMFSGAVIAGPAAYATSPAQCLADYISALGQCPPAGTPDTSGCAGSAGATYSACMASTFDEAPCDGPTCRRED